MSALPSSRHDPLTATPPAPSSLGRWRRALRVALPLGVTAALALGLHARAGGQPEAAPRPAAVTTVAGPTVAGPTVAGPTGQRAATPERGASEDSVRQVAARAAQQLDDYLAQPGGENYSQLSTAPVAWGVADASSRVIAWYDGQSHLALAPSPEIARQLGQSGRVLGLGRAQAGEGGADYRVLGCPQPAACQATLDVLGLAGARTRVAETGPEAVLGAGDRAADRVAPAGLGARRGP